MRHDFYRPAAVSRLRAGLDANGRVTSVVCHSAGQAPFKALSRRLGIVYTQRGPDKTTAEGTWDQPYEFPALRSAHAEVELPVPVGSWRSVGHSHQGFFFESFVDELAHAAKADPLRYRQALLARHPRARAVLDAVATESAWGTPLPLTADGRAQARGVALHWSFGTVVAMVAEVSRRANGSVQVHRIVAAVDCGLAVNPNGIRQQVEGSVVYGLSAALHGEVLVEQGRLLPGNFHEYPPLRMSECPAVNTVIVPSSRVPSGIGEPALAVVAPAVANALFALTGTRLRALPLQMPAAAGATP
jgi:isoquinoline 1-oxidoreductase beta subunit